MSLKLVDRWLPGVFAVVGPIVSIWIMGPPVVALAAAMLGSVALHRKTFGRRLPDPDGFLPLYLVATAWQLLHFIEEFGLGFQQRFPELLDRPAWSDTRFVGFNMVFYALFLVSAVGVLRGSRGLCCFASFFIIVMLVNGFGHVAIAVWVGGYFPGLVTGPVSFVFGILLMRSLLQQTRPNAT